MHKDEIMIVFEWHSENEGLNTGAPDLERAKRVFADPFRIVRYDEAHSGLEDRWQTLGMTNGALLVAYSARAEKIRILTAAKQRRRRGDFRMGPAPRGLSPGQIERIQAAQKRHAAIDPGCEKLSPEEFINWHPLGGISWEERSRRMKAAGVTEPAEIF